MKTTTKSILTLIAAIVAIAVSSGAVQAQTNWSGGIHFNGGFPQGDMKDQIDNNAFGIGGQIFYSPKESPLAIGFDLSWMNYGNESRREPFSTTIPDVTVNVETSNNIVQAFFVLRGQMPEGPIRLYGDALAGFNYLYTETQITDSDLFDENVASSTNQDDAAFAYGFGGGIMVPVYTRKTDGENGKGPLDVLIDGGVRYVAGGEAEYLKKGSIRRENTAVTFDTIKSKTNMMKLHLGVVVRF
ncbi:MAG: hypothetical protein GY867_06350 [bacterium]|nr:hypothetical protein [bacterium]